VELHKFVEVWIGLLLLRQYDIAANGDAAGFLGTSIGRFHQSGAAASHDRESSLGNSRPQFACERIVATLRREAC
jgi:hypothetical protein